MIIFCMLESIRKSLAGGALLRALLDQVKESRAIERIDMIIQNNIWLV